MNYSDKSINITKEDELNMRNYINLVTPLSEQSIQKILHIVTHFEYPKGYTLFEENRRNRDIYFISKGIARVYYLQDGVEATLQFAFEGEVLLSLKSYVENKVGYENIELLEPGILLKMEYVEIEKLYEENVEIANWGRKLAEKELIKMEERQMSQQFKGAAQRYSDLLEKYPQLLQRVQLGHIASYLGVSQVTLSRIRADIR